MSNPGPTPSPVPVRREPPPFRMMQVRSVVTISPHMARVTFGGPELEGLEIPAPAASVRLLIPSPGPDGLVIPTWNGNEFLLPGGHRPTIRTFTPRYLRTSPPELDLDVVLHEHGATSAWVRQAQPGYPAAVSGTGRGYAIDAAASGYLLAGDQTAIPAISQIIEAMPTHLRVHAIVEIVAEDAQQELPEFPTITAEWVLLQDSRIPGSALISAVEGAPIAIGTRVWAAGEAAAMHRIRRHLFDERGLARREATVRGYWKHGR